MKNSLQKGSGAVWTIVGVAVVAIVASLILFTSKKPNEEPLVPDTTVPVPNTSATSTTTGSPATPPEKKFVYKNGVYSSTGEYNSSGGAEEIKVTLTIKDDVVTSATVVPAATLPASVHFQAIFVSNFKQFVVGKNIADITLDKVAGSSLTPKGFNDALVKIKAEARV